MGAAPSRFYTKSGAAGLSVTSNLALMLLKLVVGLLTGSVSVLSEAVHSGVDLVAAGIAFLSVRAAERPPDPEHPFGHGKIENISALVEACLIFAAAGYILFESYHRLLTHHPLRSLPAAIAVMAVSALVNWLISRHLFAVAERTDSPALLADAHQLNVDVLTSGGVTVALALIAMTGEALLDPVIAMLVASLIVRVAWGIGADAAGGLLDTGLPVAE